MRQTIILAVLFFQLIAAKNETKAQVVINEILASNTTTNLNDFNKNFTDWVELYNNTEKEISIGGWYLSDNKVNPTKWEIPFYISIPSNAFKLFWVDKLNTSNHTNFKLNVEGESIYLFNKDTLLIDSICYPIQVPDISYGRVIGTTNQFAYFQEATPMKENSSHSIEELELSKEPVFSKEPGFYNAPFLVEIFGADDSYKIFYTMDGSRPNQESIEYKGPIEINKNTIIRARVYSDNFLPSNTITKTFFINESFSLPVLSLAIDPYYLWDKNIGIYVPGVNYIQDKWETANYFQDWERPIHIEYFDLNERIGFNMNAGVKIHGRSTRNYQQKSLAIFAKEKYGSETVPYKLFGEKSPETTKTFLLRNAGNDWGMTMFLDGLVHTLAMNEFDIDAQLYQPAIVFLNGEYWGIHNIREKINEHYIRAHYPNGAIKFDIVEADFRVGKLEASEGSMKEYNKMYNFIDSNSLSLQQNYEQVKKWIDIDEYINYLVTEIYIANRDWPFSNLKLWKFRDDTSKWRWILYDTELSFKKSNKYDNFNMFEYMLAEEHEEYPAPPWSNFLIRNLLKNDEFKNEFIQKNAIYLNTVFHPIRVNLVIDSLKKNIEPEIARNQEKWGGIRHNTFPFLATSANCIEWEANINFIRSFIEERPMDVRKEMMEYFGLKDTVVLKLDVNNVEAGSISIMGYTLSDGSFDGYVFADVPIRMKAIPNEGYEFVKWKGGEFEQDCVIKLNKNKKLTAVFKKIE